MPYNGAGTFSRVFNWVADRNAAIKIRADRMDAEMDGFATGLSTCVTKDGQTTITADIPFNGKRITGLGDASADTDALNRQSGDARYVNVAGDTMTGALVLSAGTVGAPGMSFATETDCGWYLAGANALGLSIGGGQVLGVSTTTATWSISHVPNGSVNLGSSAAPWPTIFGTLEYLNGSSADFGGLAGRSNIRFAGTAGAYGILFKQAADTAPTPIAFLNAANSGVGTISTTASGTAYNTSSDGILKEDLRPYDAGAFFDAVQIYDFKWRASDERGIGVVAQELHLVEPRAVTPGCDVECEDGTTVCMPWSVDYSKLVPHLIAEVKALRARLAAAGL